MDINFIENTSIYQANAQTAINTETNTIYTKICVCKQVLMLALIYANG